METVTLKNGHEEAKVLVSTTMAAINNLLGTQPVAFYELVAKCRDSNHKIFGNNEEKLESFALIANGTIHESIKNIVLSAITGDGMDISLTSPIAN